jgi:hypothetical protein
VLAKALHTDQHNEVKTFVVVVVVVVAGKGDAPGY